VIEVVEQIKFHGVPVCGDLRAARLLSGAASRNAQAYLGQ